MANRSHSPIARAKPDEIGLRFAASKQAQAALRETSIGRVDGTPARMPSSEPATGMLGEFGDFAIKNGRQYLTDWVTRASGGPGAPLPPDGAA